MNSNKEENIFSFISNNLTKDSLFSNGCICISLFRTLPPLAQHLIFRLLLVDKSIPKKIIEKWLTTNKHRAHFQSVTDIMKKYGILHICSNQSQREGIFNIYIYIY